MKLKVTFRNADQAVLHVQTFEVVEEGDLEKGVSAATHQFRLSHPDMIWGWSFLVEKA